MSYYFSKTIQTTFEDAITRVVDELGKEGFGVLTDIDVTTTLKMKLNVDFHRYRILGACNPEFAYQALQADDKIGALLPCNVVVQEIPGVGTEVAAIDPLASLQAANNPELDKVAILVRAKLKSAIERTV